jgi:membrane associated rhomboid family serine protease
MSFQSSVLQNSREDISENAVRARSSSVGSEGGRTSQTVLGVARLRKVAVQQVSRIWHAGRWQNLPDFTRLLLIALVSTYCLSWYPPFTQFFSFTPAETLAGLRIWNVVTYGFVEVHALHLFLTLLVLVTVGRSLEEVWRGSESPGGSTERLLELAMYVLFITAFASVLSFVITFGAFLWWRLRPEYLFASSAGFYAGNVALLVAYARYRPEQTFPSLGTLARFVPVRTFPLMYVNTIVSLVPLVPTLWLSGLVTICAFVGSWGYFRFAKKFQLPTPEVAGAPAEFPLYMLLPEFVMHILQRVGIMRGACGDPGTTSLEDGSTEQRDDSARRRATAASLLDQHLYRSATNQDAVSPTNV